MVSRWKKEAEQNGQRAFPGQGHPQDEELARLHGPVGLYIGSKTPAEIAISILAELTATKNGVELPAEVSVGNAKLAAQQLASEPSCGVGD